jgi:hypothetical protein
MVRLAILGIWMSFLAACSHQQFTVGVVWKARSAGALIPLYIEMPKNNRVFEHLSPLMYEHLVRQFMHAGYHLVSSKDQGYRLSLTVTDFYPERKFVSPDILLFHATFRLQCQCTLYNYRGEVVYTHFFSTSKLFSKPRNPVLAGNYFTYEFTQLLQGFLPMIEYRIRPFLIKQTV